MAEMTERYEKDGYILRPAAEGDAERYYEQNFHPLDAEIARLTGSRTDFTRDEVTGFFCESVKSPDYYLFLIESPDGRIMGESVLHEPDWDVRSADFRICIFHSADCGRGIGCWAVEQTRDFAFERLGLHRLSLEVFSFNGRARRTYEKAGFREEGILREAVRTEDGYADIVQMAMLEKEWEKRIL